MDQYASCNGSAVTGLSSWAGLATRRIAIVGVCLTVALGSGIADAAATKSAFDEPTDRALAGFAKEGFQPFQLPDADLPHRGDFAPLRVPKPTIGLVPVKRIGGKLFDHPVMRAQYALRSLESYRISGNAAFLARAVAGGNRAIATHVNARGAWWYPYRFGVSIQGTRLSAPWFSAMAQGETLSLFVRLYELTKESKWLDAASGTFASLTLPPTANGPWCTWADANGYLWLEEYPRKPPARSERVLNGSIFAAFGIYDYWRITGDARAASLFDGAATTVAHYAPTTIRVPGAFSFYSIKQHEQTWFYHPVHIRQFLLLHAITRHPSFARLADNFLADWAPSRIHATATITAGTHGTVSLRWPSTHSIPQYLGSGGSGGSAANLTVAETTRVRVNARVSVRGRGIYLRIAAGPQTGRWLPEVAESSYVNGVTARNRYGVTRPLQVEAGTYTGIQITSNGDITASTILETPAATLQINAVAIVNGRKSVMVADGVLAGHWLSLTSTATLD